MSHTHAMKLCGGCGAKMRCDDGDPDFRTDPEWGYCSKCFAAWQQYQNAKAKRQSAA